MGIVALSRAAARLCRWSALATLFVSCCTAAGWCQTTSSPTGKKAPQSQEKPEQGAKPLPQVSPQARYDYQGEATFVLQNLWRFHNPYQGADSFRSRNETELSHTYTLFAGARIVDNLEVYVNPEVALGHGISEGSGLAGGVNGDLIGQPSLRPEPYLARYFVRWRIPMPHSSGHRGGERSKAEQVGRAPNIISGDVPAHRLVVQIGKFGVSDVFDTNSYANNARSQFLNNAFGNNLAYDFAQETRGYDLGMSISWVNPAWALRVGSFAMPTSAGGPDLAFNVANSHADQIEAELHSQILPKRPPFVLRALAFRNVGNMGRYTDALAAQLPGMAPDITAVRRRGGVKYGFGLNMEQALADGGDTGLFARLGWNDGATESYSFAEADRSLSLGGQLSGARWRRKDDRVGVAYGQSDLTASHRRYLSAGGQGLALGDGALRYDSERTFEAYYSYQVAKPVSISLDYQYIVNPGNNRDRGPASVVALRAHITF